MTEIAGGILLAFGGIGIVMLALAALGHALDESDKRARREASRRALQAYHASKPAVILPTAPRLQPVVLDYSNVDRILAEIRGETS